MMGAPYLPNGWMTPPGSMGDPRGFYTSMPFLPPALMYQPMMDTWRPGFGMPSPYPGPSLLNPYGFSAIPAPLPILPPPPMNMGYPGSFIPMAQPTMAPGIPTPAELAPSLLRSSLLAPYGPNTSIGLPNQSFQNVAYNNMTPMGPAGALPLPQQPLLPPGLMPPAGAQNPLTQAAKPNFPQQPITPPLVDKPGAAAQPKQAAGPEKDFEKALKEATSKNTPTGFTDEVIHSLNERLNDVSNVENRRAASIEFYNMLEANPALATDPKYKPYIDAFLFKILKDTDSLVHVGALLALQLHKVQDISPEVAERLKELEHGGGLFKEEEPWAHQVLEGSHVTPLPAVTSPDHTTQTDPVQPKAASETELPVESLIEPATPEALIPQNSINPSNGFPLPPPSMALPSQTEPRTSSTLQLTPALTQGGLASAPPAFPENASRMSQLDLTSPVNQLAPRTPQSLPIPGQQLNLLSGTGGLPNGRRDGS